MWENAEEMGGCPREYAVLRSREPPPTVGSRVGPRGLPVPMSWWGEELCDSRAAGMGLGRTLCSFCNYSCGVCLQSVWWPDLQCFHMAKSFRCLQILDSSLNDQLANQSNPLWWEGRNLIHGVLGVTSSWLPPAPLASLSAGAV